MIRQHHIDSIAMFAAMLRTTVAMGFCVTLGACSLFGGADKKPAAAPEQQAQDPSAQGTVQEEAASSEGAADEGAPKDDAAAADEKAADSEAEKGEDPEKAAEEVARSIEPETLRQFEDALDKMSTAPEESVKAFEAVANKHPEFYLANYNAATVYDRLGKTNEAEAAYKRAIKAKPEDDAAVVGLAAIKMRQGDMGAAERLLTEAKEKNPAAWRARAYLAQVWVHMGRLKEARDEALAALRGDERNAGAMLALGMVYRRQKKYELSALALNQALEIDAAIGAALNELGLVYVAQDKKAQAVAMFERAAEVSPNVAAVHNNLGALRNEVGAFRAAVESVEKAVALRPDIAAYYLNLGNALRGDQKYPEAEKAYRKALELEPDMPGALFNLGVLYLDNELPNIEEIPRYTKCIEFLKTYMEKVRVSAAEKKDIDDYIKTAEKAIESEERKIERAQRRAEREAKKKAEMEAKKAEEEAQKKAEEKTADDSPPAPEGGGGEEAPSAPDGAGGTGAGQEGAGPDAAGAPAAEGQDASTGDVAGAADKSADKKRKKRKKRKKKKK